MTETRYRIACEQAERKAKRKAANDARVAAARKQARWAREGARERRYLDIITSDHDHSMDY